MFTGCDPNLRGHLGSTQQDLLCNHRKPMQPSKKHTLWFGLQGMFPQPVMNTLPQYPTSDLQELQQTWNVSKGTSAATEDLLTNLFPQKVSALIWEYVKIPHSTHFLSERLTNILITDSKSYPLIDMRLKYEGKKGTLPQSCLTVLVVVSCLLMKQRVGCIFCGPCQGDYTICGLSSSGSASLLTDSQKQHIKAF